MHLRERHLESPRLPAVLRTSWTLAFTILLLGAGAVLAATHIMDEFDLGSGFTAEVTADGSLVLREAVTGIPLVSAEPEVIGGRGGRHVTGSAFTGRTAEGTPGGLRGFAAGADDDGDGTVDEDRLDGRDNDGDGLVDEDHAAIGDAMVAINRPDGVHTEFYHWNSHRVRTTVFVSVVAEGTGRPSWRLETAGADWIEVETTAARHGVTGRAEEVAVHAFVTRMAAAADGRERWLGVSVLDEPGAGGVGRTVLDREALRVRLGIQPVALAVCTAESWLSLARLLAEAQVVRDGVTDPVDGRQAPWIVVPDCATCRKAESPPFRWRLGENGHLVLLADVAPGACTQLDPDLFRLDGHDLGAPDQVFWTPHEGAEVGVAWSTVTPERLTRTGKAPACPYLALTGLTDHGAAGILGFLFRAPHPALLRRLTAGEAPDEMTVGFLDGRTSTAAFEFDLASADPVRSAFAWAARSGQETGATAADQQELLASDRTRPKLSPELLKGWPNPFRDAINLQFKIPVTVGEAFEWENPEDRPENLDLQATIPWTRGEPRVSVKVYGIDGEELATLHEGSPASGEMTVRWNGTDAFGRKVASGTYFCKLQLDDWSVTRRIVFVR